MMKDYTNLNFTPNPTVKASSFELSFQATIKALNSATLRLSLARSNKDRSECLNLIKNCVLFLESDLNCAKEDDEVSKSCIQHSKLS